MRHIVSLDHSPFLAAVAAERSNLGAQRGDLLSGIERGRALLASVERCLQALDVLEEVYRGECAAPSPECPDASPASRKIEPFGPILIDFHNREVFATGGRRVSLTFNEFSLLALLARAAGTVVSRDALSRAVLNRPWSADERSVDQMVFQIRRKLALGPEHAQLIRSVRATGYWFCPQGSPVPAAAAPFDAAREAQALQRETHSRLEAALAQGPEPETAPAPAADPAPPPGEDPQPPATPGPSHPLRLRRIFPPAAPSLDQTPAEAPKASAVPAAAPQAASPPPAPKPHADPAIEAYLKEKGATRYPAAFAAPATATLSPADRAVLREHGERQRAANTRSFNAFVRKKR